MYRDQLLCVIAPPRVQSVEGLQEKITASGDALRAVFSKLGQVHFASLFILPPRPSTHGAGRETSLGLEIVVDDLVDSRDLINRMVALGIEIFWPLYADYSDTPDDGSADKRSRWLQNFLVANLHRADGGFVGTRDRSVKQIHQEAALFRELRKIAPSDPKDFDRETLADHIASKMQSDKRFVWAENAAPRSEWRDATMKPFTRFIRILKRFLGIAWPIVVIAAFLILFAMVGAVLLMAATAILGRDVVFEGAAVFGSCFEQAIPVVNLLLAGALITPCVIILALRQVLSVSAAIALVSTTILAETVIVIGALINYVFPHFWVDPIIKSALPILGILSAWGFVVTFCVVVLLFLLAVLLAATIAIVPPYLGKRGMYTVLLVFVVLLFCATRMLSHGTIDWFDAHRFLLAEAFAKPLVSGHSFVGGITKFDGIAGLWLSIVALGAWLIARLLSWSSVHFHQWLMEFDRPRESARRPPERAHQTHESIVVCEAELLSRCNHMISLTEIRPWRPWQRFWLRFWLRVVGLLGHMWWVDGKLGEARGIHFAHWHVIDQGRRLLFLSNYDGDFSGYLDDFIRGASNGINLIWRRSRLEKRSAAHTGQPAVARARCFPPTRFGLFRGCSHEQWFKAYVRDSMLPHVLRFEAYRETCADVDRATRVRDALRDERNVVNNDQIMRALES